MRGKLLAIGLAFVYLTSAGMADESKPMTAEQRMRARYPQPVRVGDLIGLPVLDDNASTLGHVREVVRTKENQIELIVAYDGFLGWGTRPVAVPIEVVGGSRAGTLHRLICRGRSMQRRRPGCRRRRARNPSPTTRSSRSPCRGTDSCDTNVNREVAITTW